MYNFKELLASLAISLTSIPLVVFVTDHDVLTQPLIMMTIGFSLLLFITILVVLVIPPTKKDSDTSLEGRGLVYYTCCLFLWAAVSDLAIQSRYLGWFGFESNSKYFNNGELYLSIPFGITTQLWDAFVNSTLYMIIIFQIDNKIDCRSAVMYWCGSIITSQFVVMIGAFSGYYSDKLQYAVWLNVVFIIFPVWVLCKFLFKPISVSNKNLQPLKSTIYDKILSLLLLFLCIFNTIRGLGALGSNFSMIKSYVDNFEPYIKESSKFGGTWVLYTAVYGVPFQLASIYALMHPGCAWMLNWSVFYASGMLQGTFVYMSYSFYPSSDPDYRIPENMFPYVFLMNALLVVVAHLVMFRCLSRSEFFRHSKDNLKLSKSL